MLYLLSTTIIRFTVLLFLRLCISNHFVVSLINLNRLDLFQPFARTVKQTRVDDSDDDNIIGSGCILENYYAPVHKQSLVRRQHLEDFVTGELDRDSIQENYLASPKLFQSFSFKHKFCFSDLGVPPKYARAQLSFHDSSFDIEVQHERNSSTSSNAMQVPNLQAHATCNPSILAAGTRPEMVHRLSEILKIRKLDMLVKDMPNGNDYDSGLGNL